MCAYVFIYSCIVSEPSERLDIQLCSSEWRTAVAVLSVIDNA